MACVLFINMIAIYLCDHYLCHKDFLYEFSLPQKIENILPAFFSNSYRNPKT